MDIDKLNEPSRIAKRTSIYNSQAAELAKSVNRSMKKLSKSSEYFSDLAQDNFASELAKSANQSLLEVRKITENFSALAQDNLAAELAKSANDSLLEIRKTAESISALAQYNIASELAKSANHTLIEIRRTSEDLKSLHGIAELARFELPRRDAIAELASQLQARANTAVKISELQRAIESIKTPWMDVNNKLRSINCLADHQRIGRMLANQAPFSDVVNNTLRSSLGDWRAHINWPKAISTDLAARSQFYVDLGFKPYLTDYPEPAFQEIVTTTGIRIRPPRLVEEYGQPVPRSDNTEDEEAFTRTNMAHDWLFRLETQIREFIDDLMSKAFGTEWPKHRLPNNMYEEWQEKKRQAQGAGRDENSLLAYADFTDYVRIICKRDNWREVFQPYFIRRENALETFQRLQPIRLDTMHARPITQDDELLLYAETHRLIQLISTER